MNSNGVSFLVTQALFGSWQDGDVGSVGVAGSATYANGLFTVKGSGVGMTGTADGMNFLFQPLSGDGTIIARITTVQSSNTVYAGLMIRETLAAGASNEFSSYGSVGGVGSGFEFSYRSSTGGSARRPARYSDRLLHRTG